MIVCHVREVGTGIIKSFGDQGCVWDYNAAHNAGWKGRHLKESVEELAGGLCRAVGSFNLYPVFVGAILRPSHKKPLRTALLYYIVA